MNKKHLLITSILVMICIAGTKSIQLLPWWAFTVPIMVVGIFIGLKNWKIPGFAVGFSIGFLAWILANLYFHFSSDGLLAFRFGSIYTAGALLLSGLVGGLTTGLALSTGKLITSGNETEITL